MGWEEGDNICEDAVSQSILSLENYVSKSTETLLSAVRIIGECGLEKTEYFKKRKQKEREDEWSQNVMHCHFTGLAAETADTQNLGCGNRKDTKNREPHNYSPGSGLENKPDQNKSQYNPTGRMCKKKIKVSCTSFQHALNWYRKSTR